MNEEPIERLNYYNGQRLAARDFEDEQKYHMRVRRWLNKSLFSAGIGDGLEVTPDPGNKFNVIVSPGLALDEEGREIILLEEQSLAVIGQKSPKTGDLQGNYLYIQYREETRSEESYGCPPHGNGHQKGQVAPGGPARVRADPLLGWSDTFPHESSGKIVLAQVELKQDCTVQNVYTYPRHYVGPSSITTVRQYALEGERHIDANNPGRIYFHIRGRQPNSVTLYLRAEKFSTLFYSELGQHNHNPISAGTMGNANPSLDWSHFHNLKDATTKNDSTDGIHTNHQLLAAYAGHGSNKIKGSLRIETELMVLPYGLGAVIFPPSTPLTPPVPAFTGTLVAPIPLIRSGLVYDDILPVFADPDRKNAKGDPDPFEAKITKGSHFHSFTEEAKTGDPLIIDAKKRVVAASTSYDHTHSLNPDGIIGNAGVSDSIARSQPNPKKPQPKSLTYVDNLQVYIGKMDPSQPLPAPPNKPPDDKNRTTDILTQLSNSQPTIYQHKLKLGEGKGDTSDPLANNGTGSIRLDLLTRELSFPEGEYYIELRVDGEGNGGRILYNLYVE